jgi:aspartyl protease family protein
VLEDVRASVLPGLDDTGVLLGMSALSQLELRQKGDTLTLIR